ncbi:MacB-like periplasmic core domain [Rubrobacter radiotolerans]|uniref:ABC transporter permease n=1 Tax=Rubrobacter radiotolerans TaxID=42256 RepID=A0A023X0M1_RUBRA|nr:ABC transporter permease [Rubrobacter radiotolerans]AHY46017.1 MacB-like periplasmic core domain [Rubrobacter radiotolerans]MDX5893429.1 ABC transporter permease [Rubrobacter radiotolerans]SMC03716.1 putative ABC transport system permease protein [Rubrobacter radiotolerans DSM 5868]
MRLGSYAGLSARSLFARPQRTLLTAVGIILGVGIVFGVLVLSDTMSQSFQNLYSRAYGSADLSVSRASGDGGFDAARLEEVRGTPGVAEAAGRLSVSSSLVLPGERPDDLPEGVPTPPEVQSAQLSGVEPDDTPLATGFELEEGRYPESGAELALDTASAEGADLALGDGVTISTPEGTREVELVGLLRAPGGSFGGIAFGTLPLGFAQEEFDEAGNLSSIAVNVAEGAPVADVERSLNEALGEGFAAERAETRTQEITDQLQVFRLTLLFFAGTALFVGAFLVFNALSMTVLERTRELGMLRALGSTRAMISRSVVVEAALLGTLGSLLGLLFGYGMARGLVLLFGQAFTFRIEEVAITPFALVSAVVVGTVVTTLAALYPALRAGRVSPVEAMRSRSGSAGGAPQRSRAASKLLPLLGLALAVGCGWWIFYLARNLAGSLDGLVIASGIAGVIGAFLGVSLVVPVLVRPLAALFSPLLRLLFGVEGRMAAANATRNRNRTALTASALMVGIALVVAFSALGGSVLGSIQSYLEDSLGSDYVVQPQNQQSGESFSEALPERISEVRGVEATTSIASSFERDGDRVSIVFGLDERYGDIFTLNYAEGGPESFEALQRDGEAIVGSQLAERRDLSIGSTVNVPAGGEEREYRVAGVLENDALGGGSGVYVSKETLARDFGEDESQFLAIKAEPGTDRQALTERLEGVLADYPQFALFSNAEWKEQIERDFNRQYVFFYAIMGVSVAVSAFGVVNTLSMSVFERTREIGILRAVGTTRLQVGRLIVDEGVIISLIGCLLGVAVGSLLGYLFVLGTSAGGFEVAFFYPTRPAIAALLSGFIIGALAGLLPARTAARKNVVEAVQYE